MQNKNKSARMVSESDLTMVSLGGTTSLIFVFFNFSPNRASSPNQLTRVTPAACTITSSHRSFKMVSKQEDVSLFVWQVKSLITDYFFPKNLSKNRPNPRKEGLSEIKLDELMVAQYQTSVGEVMHKLHMTRTDLFARLDEDGFEIRMAYPSLSTVEFHLREERIFEKEVQMARAIREAQKTKPKLASFLLPMPEIKFGLEVVHPSCDSGPMAPLGLAEIPKMRVKEEPIEVYVTKAKTPSNFYVQPIELDGVRYNLLDAMQKLYQSDVTAHLRINGIYENLVGLLVACLVESNFECVYGPLWQRGKIVRPLFVNKVSVFLIDSGEEVEVLLEDCRLLIKDFGQIPPLAVPCRLAALSPRNRDKGWSKNAIKWFRGCFIEPQEKFTILTYGPQVAMNAGQYDKLDVCLIERKNRAFGGNERNLNDTVIAFDFASAHLLALDSTGHLPWQDEGLHPRQLPQFLQPENTAPTDVVFYTEMLLRGDFLKDEPKVEGEKEHMSWSAFDIPPMDPVEKCQHWLLSQSREFQEVVTEESEGENDKEKQEDSTVKEDENELKEEEIQDEKGKEYETNPHETNNSDAVKLLKSNSYDKELIESIITSTKGQHGIEHDERYKSASDEFGADGSEKGEEYPSQSIFELWPQMKLTVATVIETSEVSSYAYVKDDEDEDMISDIEKGDIVEEGNKYNDDSEYVKKKNDKNEGEMNHQSSFNLSWPWIGIGKKSKDSNDIKTTFTVPEEVIYYIGDQ